MSTPSTELRVPHARVVVDLSAIRDNVAALAQRAAPAQTMAVVKANGYGHGLVPSAVAARAGGASWLGTAVLAEAMRLRRAGDEGRILAWLAAPGEDFAAAIRSDIDLAAYGSRQLAEIVAAARDCGRPARVHLKIDTGLSRGGATPAEWPRLLAEAARAQRAGDLDVVGVWSHLAYADEPGNPTIAAQMAVFEDAVAAAEGAGLDVQLRHLANSAATLTLPAAHYDLVRPGLSVYGLSPVPQTAGPADLGLRPAMSLTARVSLVKTVPAGSGVSYGHTYTTPRETRLALVPLGYADGVPRHASQTGPLLLGGRSHTVAGRVCMDQFVVDVGPGSDVAAGDEVWLWGDGSHGEPTAEDWAVAASTISYEIVTRVSPRLPTHYVGWHDVGLSAEDVTRDDGAGEGVSGW